MKSIYFTITGTNHYHGLDFFAPKMKVRLVKEPENKYDKEAIRVELPGLGKVGYVANSTGTVLGESFSAGRLYDRIGDAAEGSVLYKLRNGVLCILTKNDVPGYSSGSAAQASRSSSSGNDEYPEEKYGRVEDHATDRGENPGGLVVEVPDIEFVFE